MGAGRDAHQQTDDVLKKIIAELTERNKELNCLYAISRIIERRGHSLEETLQQVVDTLPAAWQYPEHTCARIILENQMFTTSPFAETSWRQACKLLVNGRPAGVVEIFCRALEIEDNAPYFMKEEADLLEAVAD